MVTYGDYRTRCTDCGMWQTALCLPGQGASAADAPRSLRFRAGTRIDLDEVTSTFGMVRSGMVRQDAFARPGRRQMQGLVLPGEPLGDLLGRSPGGILTAIRDTRVCRLPVDPTQELSDCSPAFRHALLRAFSCRLSRLQTILWMRASLGTLQRVAGLLFMAQRFMPLRPRGEGQLVLEFVMPRQDAADLMGTTVESMSRATHELERRGLIRIHDARHFELCAPATLGQMSALDNDMLDALFPLPALDGGAERVPPRRVTAILSRART